LAATTSAAGTRFVGPIEAIVGRCHQPLRHARDGIAIDGLMRASTCRSRSALQAKSWPETARRGSTSSAAHQQIGTHLAQRAISAADASGGS
jgi:hypothetical protein